jgi:hypothetical protein
VATETPSAPPAAAPKPKSVVVEAPDENKARAAAAQALKVPANQLVLKVVKREKKGPFGLGGEVLTIQATWHPPATAPKAPSAAVPSDENGRIEFSCVKGQLSVAIHRPQGRGRPADLSAVEQLIEDWPLDARDDDILQQSLKAHDGKARVFATLRPSVQPPEGAPAAVRVAKDDFTAWLIPWNPEPLTAAAIFEIVGNAGIVNGLDEELVEHLHDKVLDRPTVIARGRHPKDGQDARIEYVFEALQSDKEREAVEKKDSAVATEARVDFREMGRGPASVEPGAVLARKVPIVPAEDGFTVKGKVIPAKKPKDVELRRLAGQHTKVSEDGNEIVADGGGMASRVGDRIAVLPVHTVEDVDFKTGNVYFEGNLQIKGGVKPGFKVTATGSVNVGQTVEAATIEAGGDVTVQGGIVGQKECVIRAGGAVTARFVQEAEIHAGAGVTIASEVRDSTIISEGKVTIAGAGRVVGGRLRGRDGVEIREAGSQAATPTSIQAGWGEVLDAEVPEGESHPLPYVAIRNEVQPGVVITVAGATQRFTRNSVGGVWREKDGKLLYSAN